MTKASRFEPKRLLLGAKIAAFVLVASMLVVCLSVPLHNAGPTPLVLAVAWLCQLAFTLGCGAYMLWSGWQYDPAREPQPEEAPASADPGFAALSFYYPPQRLDSPAAETEPLPAPHKPPQVEESLCSRLALVLAVVCAVAPELILPQFLVLVMGITQVAPNKCMACRRLGWAALTMAGTSLFGLILLLSI